jgi:hypothetical protein
MKFNLLRFTNSVILVAIIVLTLTGVYGLFWSMPSWTFDLHRAAGWLLIATIPWKTAISLLPLTVHWAGTPPNSGAASL